MVISVRSDTDCGPGIGAGAGGGGGGGGVGAHATNASITAENTEAAKEWLLIIKVLRY
jgi:hypothetical protein